ncbi:unnamed protein product [Bursaphelenchus okinawaensis]|uniref:Striatin N-terminal domain-containing protein n=1 Tax=Bursaphelenchus okinawaensis TaxID=465554 RepID=A0A811LKL9_9BILA|nr:unnamed protein product [Bursaphelenchus okinawaensis]CAG9127554.1 unnamed protein product [Bursaphelenchus okinawaensis]
MRKQICQSPDAVVTSKLTDFLEVSAMQLDQDNSPQTSELKDLNGEDGPKEESNRPPFTVNSVLHFLQSELNRYEIERAQWEMERTELIARVNFLNGERKGQEELKRDLVRRIKMLEYSLKQERAKVARLTSEAKTEGNEENEEVKPTDEPLGAIEVDAVIPNPQTSPVYKQARSLLRQYLNEIGYSEKILDVRAFRVKNLLGIVPGNNEGFLNDGSKESQSRGKVLTESEKAILEAADLLRSNNINDNDDASDSEGSGGNLDAEAVTAIEFEFLNEEKNGPSAEEWNVDPNRIEAMKDDYFKKLKEKASRDEEHKQETKEQQFFHQLNESCIPKEKLLEMNEDINIKDVTELNNDSPSIQWRIAFTLRSHLDSVRAMKFHPFEPVLVTASEDGTAKMWNLADKDTKGQQSHTTVMGVVDLEPRYTFRGHKGHILSMDMNSTGDSFYTGGYDGVICCWEMPPFDIPIYDQYDPRFLAEKLVGHTQPVWSVVYHSSSNRLISGSADGTIRLWELGLAKGEGQEDPQLKLYAPPTANARPRALDLVSTETQRLLAAYTGKSACMLDLETGQKILDFDLSLPEDEVGEINSIISHPTMPVSIMAGVDRKIRYFDNHTGKLVRSAVSHVESISTLAADPNGLYMLSGCEDGSLRVWDMESKTCIQEIAAHRKKHDMSVMAVAIHPSRPLIGSAGADSLVKVFSQRSYSAS